MTHNWHGLICADCGLGVICEEDKQVADQIPCPMKRGKDQNRSIECCPMCNGKGCDFCRGTGKVYRLKVDPLLTKGELKEVEK